MRSAAVFFSQPSVSLSLLQSVKPRLQTALHIPAAQVGLVMLLLEHTLPQPPQFLLSVWLLISHPSLRLSLLQSRKPALHMPVHMLAEQVLARLLPEQGVAQPPQLATSLVRLISHPSV